MKITSFRDLISWQKSKDLAVEIYKITQRFPKEELFGITNQIRRAAVSVPSNISKGFGRSAPKDQYQFFTIALGSLFELENQLIIATEIGYVNRKDLEITENKIEEIGKMINGLRRINIQMINTKKSRF